MRPCTTARSWMGCWTRATPAMMCSPTALIARPRSRGDFEPAALRAVFIGAPLATIRYRMRNLKRTVTGAKFAPASNTCSELKSPRRAAESCARSASCGHAPRLACRTGLQHSPPCDAGAHRHRMRVKSARSIRKGASSGQTAASLVENHARKPPSSALIANHASKPALFEVPKREFVRLWNKVWDLEKRLKRLEDGKDHPSKILP